MINFRMPPTLTCRAIRAKFIIMDRFRNFAALRRHAREDRDFTVETRKGQSGYAIMAPHGGGIEPATAITAAAIAGTDHGYYALKGIRSRNNGQLHIASERFDEPRALALAKVSHTVITVHGCSGGQLVVYTGGRDARLRGRVVQYLADIGISVDDIPPPSLGGLRRDNLCNQGNSGKGLQMELSAGFRRRLMGPQISRDSAFTPQLRTFAQAIRQALYDHLSSLNDQSKVTA